MSETYQLIIWLDSKHASGSEDSRFATRDFLISAVFISVRTRACAEHFPRNHTLFCRHDNDIMICEPYATRYALHINCYQISNQKEKLSKIFIQQRQPTIGLYVFRGHAGSRWHLSAAFQANPLEPRLTWRFWRFHTFRTVERTLPCEKSIDTYLSLKMRWRKLISTLL